jgi:hypothetical protein
VLLVVNVVVPHPLPAALNDPPNLNVGRSSAIVSGVDVSSGELSAKMYEIDDGPSASGLTTSRRLCWNPAVGATTAVDAEMDPLAAAIFVADANVTATVRVLRFAV